MNFIYTEEFRFHLNSVWDKHYNIKLVINQSGVVVLTYDDIQYQCDILNIVPCKYHSFGLIKDSVKACSNNDYWLFCVYNPKLSLPIYCWFNHLPDFLDFQRKVEEVIEGQKFAKFAEYDHRICYMV
jgi:hypothetical protein